MQKTPLQRMQRLPIQRKLQLKLENAVWSKRYTVEIGHLSLVNLKFDFGTHARSTPAALRMQRAHAVLFRYLRNREKRGNESTPRHF